MLPAAPRLNSGIVPVARITYVQYLFIIYKQTALLLSYQFTESGWSVVRVLALLALLRFLVSGFVEYILPCLFLCLILPFLLSIG